MSEDAVERWRFGCNMAAVVVGCIHCQSENWVEAGTADDHARSDARSFALTSHVNVVALRLFACSNCGYVRMHVVEALVSPI